MVIKYVTMISFIFLCSMCKKVDRYKLLPSDEKILQSILDEDLLTFQKFLNGKFYISTSMEDFSFLIQDEDDRQKFKKNIGYKFIFGNSFDKKTIENFHSERRLISVKESILKREGTYAIDDSTSGMTEVGQRRIIIEFSQINADRTKSKYGWTIMLGCDPTNGCRINGFYFN